MKDGRQFSLRLCVMWFGVLTNTLNIPVHYVFSINFGLLDSKTMMFFPLTDMTDLARDIGYC